MRRCQVCGREWVGRDRLRAMFAGAPGGLHLGGPPVIELDGDQARTLRNLLFVERSGEQRARSTTTISCAADGWRIARTRCQFIVPDGLSDRPG